MRDPFWPASNIALNWIQIPRGPLTEAVGAARRTLEISNTYSYAYYYLGITLLTAGAREPALATFEKETDEGGRLGGIAMAGFALKRRAESDASLATMLKQQTNDNAFGIAEVHAFRGEKDQALRWLDRAYAQRDVSLHFIKAVVDLLQTCRLRQPQTSRPTSSGNSFGISPHSRQLSRLDFFLNPQFRGISLCITSV
jgi:tetratricopeptide (TPR) repeat protein